MNLDKDLSIPLVSGAALALVSIIAFMIVPAKFILIPTGGFFVGVVVCLVSGLIQTVRNKNKPQSLTKI